MYFYTQWRQLSAEIKHRHSRQLCAVIRWDKDLRKLPDGDKLNNWYIIFHNRDLNSTSLCFVLQYCSHFPLIISAAWVMAPPCIIRHLDATIKHLFLCRPPETEHKSLCWALSEGCFRCGTLHDITQGVQWFLWSSKPGSRKRQRQTHYKGQLGKKPRGSCKVWLEGRI